MGDLVNALLNVSRIEMGTFMVEPIPSDLIQIMRSVLDELKLTIDNESLQVSESHDPLPNVLVDPKIMRIIYQNLLTNAVKYTPKDGKINIKHTLVNKGQTLNNHPAATDFVLITVADTGYGIPKAQQSHVFEKLFRADNIKERDPQGTGLGLYIVKSIIEQSGGAIWFKSQENKGTTFYVTLPVSGMKKKEGTKTLE
jgi:signal transduction histidine kinase